jgi:23S rRNA (guanine745-N1)-methyltransferase
VCRARLCLIQDERRWECPVGHSFDVAREGYVNLLLAGQRRSHQPGDSAEMVTARHRFLATGAFDPMSDALADVVGRERPTVVLDVGCGEGRHTRKVAASVVLGIDVAKAAVSVAARAHREGWYAVASAADLPLADAAAEVALSVFGPVVPGELARVVRRHGVVVALHPGPAHLASLRTLVYADVRPHEVKPPLRDAAEWFTEIESIAIRFPIVVHDAALLGDLFAMTPYRWHGPPDVRARLTAAASSSFETAADVLLTTYRRTDRPHPDRRGPKGVRHAAPRPSAADS